MKRLVLIFIKWVVAVLILLGVVSTMGVEYDPAIITVGDVLVEMWIAYTALTYLIVTIFITYLVGVVVAFPYMIAVALTAVIFELDEHQTKGCGCLGMPVLYLLINSSVIILEILALIILGSIVSWFPSFTLLSAVVVAFVTTLVTSVIGIREAVESMGELSETMSETISESIQ